MIGSSPGDIQAAARLRGQGCFVADVALTRPLHLAFVRSPVPVGRIAGLDLSNARGVPGVHAVHAGAEVAHLGDLPVNPVLPMAQAPAFPVLAEGHVGCLGQPLAAVLAETLAAARDGVEAIWPEIEAPRDTADAVPSDTVAQRRWCAGDPATAFAEAAHVIEAQINHPRLAPSPLEGRAIAVEWGADRLTIWHATQTPHRTRSALAQILNIDPATLRVIAPDVGGAFGMKASLYPEEVCAVWAALTHRRSVRWIATRGEDMLSATQGRGLHTQGQLAVDAEGRFIGLRARVRAPVGPWLPNSALVPGWNAARILPGGYEIPSVDISTEVQVDALGVTGIYRGAGRPEAACLMERLVAGAARVTGLDPMEIRLLNLHSSTALPYRTVTGNLLDSGDYARALDKAVHAADYATLKRRRRARRADGHLSGIGVAFYLEPSGEGFETARVTWRADATVLVASGSSSQGQGRETAYGQIVAEVLDVAMDAITVVQGDTDGCPAGIGAVASRGTPIGGSAVFTACERLRARRLAGQTLPMSEDVRYEVEGQAWGYGVYVVSLEVDTDTGEISFETVTCVDDAGCVINPAFVEGQVRGGFAQGFGEAMMEAMIFDTDGQLLTGSLMDYALPRASDMPAMAIHSSEHPSGFNALGAKGVGEAGTIGGPAAILNAVHDALEPLGVGQLDMPLTPCKVWTAIRAAHRATEGDLR